MSDLLSSPPRIKKSQKKEDTEESSRFFVERTDSSLLGGGKTWKYFARSPYGETKGFASSRWLALLKIKMWLTREELRKRKAKRRGGESIGREEIVAFAGERFPLHSFREETLRGQKLEEDVLVYSGQRVLSLGKSGPWQGGIIEKRGDDTVVKKVAEDERSRRRTEKLVRKEIEAMISKRELEALESSEEV